MSKSYWAKYKDKDPRKIPVYTFPDAAHHLKIPRTTLRDWVKGRYYPAGILYDPQGSDQIIMKRSKPLINLPDPEFPYLSFINLIEAHVLNAIRNKHHIPLYKVRNGLDYLHKYHKSEHPLADQWFQTDGVNLFIEGMDKELINIGRYGQVALPEIFQMYLQRIDRDIDGVPQKLYPFVTREQAKEPFNIDKEKTRSIVIDPTISFGKPVIAGTTIPTESIYSLYKAGESEERIAYEYGCQEEQVKEAIRYESKESKAA